jgi:von Willebrand factor A domain-containing protein 7
MDLSLPILLALVFGTSDAQRRFGPGVCGPVDPVYIETASQTGGQPFFLSTAETAQSARIMTAASRTELMLWASGNGEKSYTIPVDSSVDHATFSASFDGTGGSLTVISPDGTEVRQDERTEDTVLNCGRVVAIDRPAAGAWQVRVSPSGRFWLAARAKSEMSLIAADFVRLGGRPGHEGLFRIQGYPVAGKPATLRVRLSSTPAAPTFQLISIDGRALQTLDLKAADAEEFVGTIALPADSFRVAVNGVDASGMAFQRLSAALLHAALVEVIPPPLDRLTAGTTTPVTFTVRNTGPSIRLTLTATDGRGKVVPVEPPILQLEPQTEGTATVRVTVPADAASDKDVSVFLTTSGSSPSAMNYARKQFTVTRQ